jgi:hypothetical protein
MNRINGRAPRALLGLLAVVLAGLALGVATNAAGAADKAQTGKHGKKERLVVRGEATIVDNPSCPGGVCELKFVDGSFRGTPVGTGAYDGAVKLKVAEAFSNGEGGVCAPIEGRITLGTGTPNRLVLAISGDSCQDGAGPLPASSFTTLSRFTVKYGTGTYAGARGSGVVSSSEDAADRDRMTVIGQITR